MIKVDREKVAVCMTCPLCDKLFTEATTISECLHTFCRKCIYDKITDDELDHCPICNIELGGTPLEKLRADHNLQDLRAKIFSSKRPNAEAPEVLPSVLEAETPVPVSGRRKERSITSLVLSKPKASAKQIGKRKNPNRRKKRVLQEHSVSCEEEQDDDWLKDFDSPEIARRFSRIGRLSCSTAGSSKQHLVNNITCNSGKSDEEKADLWKPLNCLVDAATESEPNKSNLQEVQPKLEPWDENGAQVLKDNVKEQVGNRTETNGSEGSSVRSSPASRKPRRLQGVRQKRAAVTQDLNIPAKTIAETKSKSDGRFGPFWFSLVASDDQGRVAPLPQTSSCYLRVRDGSLPVSTIKKYLGQKLGLASEADVEIWFHGQPVLSTVQLHNLVEWWLQTTPAASERIRATAGSSANDFVMVLSYGGKLSLPKLGWCQRSFRNRLNMLLACCT